MTRADHFDTLTDTVSALSVPDPDFGIRKQEFDRARRRALDDAIRRKDWELAASVTDNIRNRSMDSSEAEVLLIPSGLRVNWISLFRRTIGTLLQVT
jgi:hypothetical protein